MQDHKIIQLKIKTVRDLQYHLKHHGRARHMVHDGETDWWWFADDRNRLLEAVFNSGRRVTFTPSEGPDGGADKTWEVTCDLIPHFRGFRPQTLFLTPRMSIEILTDLFWTDFLNHERERFAYWDMENPDNGFEEYLFYREMHETGAYQESLRACPPAHNSKQGGVGMSTKRGLATSVSLARVE